MDLRGRIDHHLQVLVQQAGARPPGSPANRRATEHVRDVLGACGLTVTEHRFETTWWEPGDGRLEVAGRVHTVEPNPYSRPGDVRGRVTRAGDLAQLEGLAPDPGRVLALVGELAREQVMPAAFPFLELPEHARIRDALVRSTPAAVIAVSDHWEPILEDPDLHLLSTTVSTSLGTGLQDGVEVRLTVGGGVHRGRAATIAARQGPATGRIVCCAHLDSKATTPGAFDNAAGVATLLAAVEQGLDVGRGVEIVLFNGEDHYDAGGEVAWLASTDLDEVAAVVNLDGIGLAGQRTSLASLSCPEPLEAQLDTFCHHRPGWLRVDPWIESDHAIFAMRGIPAIALTSEDVHQLLGGLAHTAADTLDVLDRDTLIGVARDLPELAALVADQV